MKYFLDTEFLESPCTIELISVGIVSEDGHEFYAESNEFNKSDATPWLEANVLPHLWGKHSDKWETTLGGYMTRNTMARLIRAFVGDYKPEFWGYYSAYDWVVFCWLFGSMINLPKGWPMYCRDIKQYAGDIRLPQQTSIAHNALEDARWNRQAWEHVNNIKGNK